MFQKLFRTSEQMLKKDLQTQMVFFGGCTNQRTFHVTYKDLRKKMNLGLTLVIFESID